MFKFAFGVRVRFIVRVFVVVVSFGVCWLVGPVVRGDFVSWVEVLFGVGVEV